MIQTCCYQSLIYIVLTVWTVCKHIEGVDHIEIPEPNKENDNTIKDITDTAQPDYLL